MPQPIPHCARWGSRSLSSEKEHSPQFSSHVYCGQTAGWIKMPLGMEVSLGPGLIVLDEDPAPPQKGAPPQFSSVSVAHRRPDANLLSFCLVSLTLLLFTVSSVGKNDDSKCRRNSADSSAAFHLPAFCRTQPFNKQQPRDGKISICFRTE